MKLSTDAKMILKFGAPLVVSIILFLIVGKFGLGKVSEVRLKVQDSRNDVSALTQKLNSISQIDESVLESSTLASVALPESNPLLSVISQIKTQSLEKGLFLNNIKTGSETSETGGLKRIDISFDVEGSRDRIVAFLFDMQRIAPISLIDKAKINEIAGVSRANVTVRAFWSEFPKNLPGITESLKELTNEDIAMLTQMLNLIQPTFVKVEAQEVINVRPNPFSF